MAAEEEQDKKPDIPTKSSMEILSELFSTFQAKPPIIIKKEKTEKTEDSKKHKKKHKHKDKKLDKKPKKKDKKRKRKRSRSNSSSDSSSSEESEEKVDLAQILIKNEKENAEKKIKSVKKEKDSKQEDIPKKDVKVEVKVKDEVHKTEETGKKNKIVIKDLKLSKVFEAEAKKIYEKHADQEEGEASDSDSHSKHKCKKKHKSHSKKRSRSKSRERHHSDKKVKSEETKSRTSDSKYREKSKDRDKSRNHNRDHSRDRNRDHSRDRNRDHSRDRSRDDFYGRRKERSRERDSRKDKYSSTRESTREHKSRDQHRDRDEYNRELEDYRRNRSKLHKDDDFYKSKDKGSSQREEKWFMRDRYRGYDDRDKYDRDNSSKIDKKKLLEIARKNAITMMKSGSLPAALTLGPQAQEKVIAAIKSGGKTIEELTDFCKTLSKKEELGELSSLSEKEDSDSDNDKAFHHPFQIKDRPTSITMNIKNSVPLPIKSTVERTSELRIQFPVSSGQQHRKGEHWRPVSPPAPPADKKEEPAPAPVPPPVPLAIEPAPVPAPEPKVVTVPAPANAPPGPQVFPTPINEPSIDIGSIVSQRLTAMRRLQENPNDVQALGQMYKSNKEMQSWASSKQQLGQFTGSTGAQIMSQAELSSGYQAWAKKDQLQTAAPVSGGMGMHLLQKMGWKPGEGLGKEKTGQLEPLLLEVKLDKRGLVADEEQQGRGGKGKRQKGAPTQKTLQGKHPVSLLGEYASKRKLGAPQYIMEFECGPDHKKNFLFKVVLNGLEYKPNVASNNKKEAKAVAATVCLQQIGLFPS